MADPVTPQGQGPDVAAVRLVDELGLAAATNGLGSAPCPECGKFARVVVAGHYAYPDGYWTYTTDCRRCGRSST